jgi:hypothetical protein
MQLTEPSEGDCDQEGATCPPKNTQPGRMPSSLNRRARRFKAPNLVETEFMSLLPSLEVATLLVETYFERVHWFTLVFHQTGATFVPSMTLQADPKLATAAVSDS